MIQLISHLMGYLTRREKHFMFSISKQRNRFIARTAWRFKGEYKWIRNQKAFTSRKEAEHWLKEQEFKMKGYLRYETENI